MNKTGLKSILAIQQRCHWLWQNSGNLKMQMSDSPCVVLWWCRILLHTAPHRDWCRILSHTAPQSERCRILLCTAPRSERCRILLCTAPWSERCRILLCTAPRSERCRILLCTAPRRAFVFLCFWCLKHSYHTLDVESHLNTQTYKDRPGFLYVWSWQ